jgi:pyruvate/2-oxoglutarate dehydrogenase complex dihydrolipoamide acyltransferase (E2) component
VPDGAEVTAGTLIATVETSKASNDIEADQGGVLRHHRRVGEDCPFGEPIAFLVAAQEARAPGAAPEAPPQVARAPGAAPEAPPVVRTGGRVQTAVAAAVSRSHREIPAAFTAARVDVSAALAMVERSGSSDSPLDLPTLLVKAIGLLGKDFPAFFGSVAEDGTHISGVRPDVAVTLDAGAGLYLPVVRDVAMRSLDEIADDLMEFRLLALDGRFTDGQLNGAAISLSLNLSEGISLVQPLILPPQVCMVSVGGVERVPRLRPDGRLTESRVLTVGLAYDHRVVNGAAAVEFLLALSDRLEHPERLASN